jgi:hypothetical protein
MRSRRREGNGAPDRNGRAITDVAAEFIEPGNTAADDRRPAFQAMIDAALVKPPTFTVIVVHSFSPFWFTRKSQTLTTGVHFTFVRLISD